jgi:hypothetical protein
LDVTRVGLRNILFLAMPLPSAPRNLYTFAVNRSSRRIGSNLEIPAVVTRVLLCTSGATRGGVKIPLV